MISAINMASIRKNIPSFLTVPFGRITRLIKCGMLSILSNNAVMGYFVVAEVRNPSGVVLCIIPRVQTYIVLNLHNNAISQFNWQGGEGIRTLINPLTSKLFSAGERMAALPPHHRSSPEFSKIKTLLMSYKFSHAMLATKYTASLHKRPLWFALATLLPP